MKKTLVTIMFVLALAVMFGWFLNWADSNDPAVQEWEEFGSIYYADDLGGVRVKEVNEGSYQIYVCWYDPNNGALKEYQTFGIYPEEEVYEGASRAISFYQNSR